MNFTIRFCCSLVKRFGTLQVLRFNFDVRPGLYSVERYRIGALSLKSDGYVRRFISGELLRRVYDHGSDGCRGHYGAKGDDRRFVP